MVVPKETVVLRRWESITEYLSIIKLGNGIKNLLAGNKSGFLAITQLLS